MPLPVECCDLWLSRTLLPIFLIILHVSCIASADPLATLLCGQMEFLCKLIQKSTLALARQSLVLGDVRPPVHQLIAGQASGMRPDHKLSIYCMCRLLRLPAPIAPPPPPHPTAHAPPPPLHYLMSIHCQNHLAYFLVTVP